MVAKFLQLILKVKKNLERKKRLMSISLSAKVKEGRVLKPKTPEGYRLNYISQSSPPKYVYKQTRHKPSKSGGTDGKVAEEKKAKKIQVSVKGPDTKECDCHTKPRDNTQFVFYPCCQSPSCKKWKCKGKEMLIV